MEDDNNDKTCAFFSQKISTAMLVSTTFYISPFLNDGKGSSLLLSINSSVSIVVSLDKDLIMKQVWFSNC